MKIYIRRNIPLKYSFKSGGVKTEAGIDWIPIGENVVLKASRMKKDNIVRMTGQPYQALHIDVETSCVRGTDTFDRVGSPSSHPAKI